MAKLKCKVRLDLDAIEDKITDEIDAVVTVDVDESTYSITSVDVKEDDGEYEVEIELERDSGKFVSNDDLADAINDMLSGSEIEIPFELEW